MLQHALTAREVNTRNSRYEFSARDATHSGSYLILLHWWINSLWSIKHLHACMHAEAWKREKNLRAPHGPRQTLQETYIGPALLYHGWFYLFRCSISPILFAPSFSYPIEIGIQIEEEKEIGTATLSLHVSRENGRSCGRPHQPHQSWRNMSSPPTRKKWERMHEFFQTVTTW